MNYEFNKLDHVGVVAKTNGGAGDGSVAGGGGGGGDGARPGRQYPVGHNNGSMGKKSNNLNSQTGFHKIMLRVLNSY